MTASRQGDLIVRHLLLPGHFDCCFRPIVSWLRANLPGVKFSIRDGYLPSWQAFRHAELARPLEPGSGRPRSRSCCSRGVEGHRMKAKRDQTPPAVDESTESEITIQPDGRVFAFGITKPLAAVLGDDPDVGRAHEKPAAAASAASHGAAGAREPLDTKETQ